MFVSPNGSEVRALLLKLSQNLHKGFCMKYVLLKIYKFIKKKLEKNHDRVLSEYAISIRHSADSTS